jgi:ATP-dependent DNA helicase RecG
VSSLLGPHSSRPFNPNVANAFFCAGEIEAWGRGIQRIIDSRRAAGGRAPSIRYDPGDLWVEFPFTAGYVEAVAAAGEQATSVRTPVKTPVKILGLLRDRPEVSLAEVARAIGKSQSAVERATAKLVKAGRLRRLGPARGGRWEVVD